MANTTQRQREEWLAEFQAIAAEWGGACLSAEYVNQSTKLKFECSEGHIWSALPMNVFHRGSWCPHCSGNARLSMIDAKAAAKAHGGRCLSRVYVSVHAPLRWRCGAGHHFTASLTSVRTMGGFCMECQKLTLGEFQRLAESIGYTVLSDEYVNNYTHIRMQCDVGHIWEVRPSHFKRGTRCPNCMYGWDDSPGLACRPGSPPFLG